MKHKIINTFTTATQAAMPVCTVLAAASVSDGTVTAAYGISSILTFAGMFILATITKRCIRAQPIRRRRCPAYIAHKGQRVSWFLQVL